MSANLEERLKQGSQEIGQALRHPNQRRALSAALTNEQLTRQRVDNLEAAHKRLFAFTHDVDSELARFTTLGLKARLRWLFLGR